MADALKIGEVAARAGVTAKAIRFYEAAGVLPQLEGRTDTVSITAMSSK